MLVHLGAIRCPFAILIGSRRTTGVDREHAANQHAHNESSSEHSPKLGSKRRGQSTQTIMRSHRPSRTALAVSVSIYTRCLPTPRTRLSGKRTPSPLFPPGPASKTPSKLRSPVNRCRRCSNDRSRVRSYRHPLRDTVYRLDRYTASQARVEREAFISPARCACTQSGNLADGVRASRTSRPTAISQRPMLNSTV
jgi:hypothetical protein